MTMAMAMAMASSSNSSSLFLFSSRSPPSIPLYSKKNSILSPIIHSRRHHPVVVLKEKSCVYLGFCGSKEDKGFQRNHHWIQRRCNNKGVWDLDYREEEEKEIVQENEIVDFNSRAYSSSTPSSPGRDMGKEEEEEEEESVEEDYADLGINWDKLFRSRVQHLELELASTLGSLKPVSEIDTLKGISDSPSDEFQETKGMNAKNKLRSIRANFEILEGKITLESQKNLEMKQKRINESPSDEFLEISDAWGETEVMNAKNKLRSIRAKLAILEGMIILVTIESQKNLEMKQKRINDAQLALSTLRTACIVWPSNKALVIQGNSSRNSSNSEDYLKTLGVIMQKIWDVVLEAHSETERLWESCGEGLRNIWRSYVKSSRLEYDEKMGSVFPDFDPDQPPPMFMKEADRTYYNNAFHFFRWLIGAVRSPLKVVILWLMTVPVCMVMLVVFTFCAWISAVWGEDTLANMFMIFQLALLKWLSKHSIWQYFYPKPPKQPRPKKPKAEEGEVIDVEGRVVEEGE